MALMLQDLTTKELSHVVMNANASRT